METAIKVLVIDDDEVDRLTLQRALKKSEIPHTLTECEDPSNGLALLKSDHFDCIFLDYLLPGTDGLMLLRKFRNEGIKTPVIVVTSQGDENIAVEMMKSGASDYVVKDQINALTIKNIIQRVTHLSEIEKQREAAEQALKISESRLSQAQRIAKIGNWEYSFRTREFYWSEEMYRIFERDPETFQPATDHYLTLFHPTDSLIISRGIRKALCEKFFSADVRVVLADGNLKYVNIQAHFDSNDLGKHEKLIGTVQDITERKKVERELTEAKKMAEESGKIKEQFLANMSHEIRTPMNAVVGFTNLLLEQHSNLTPEQTKYIKAIHNAGDHLLVIINDILDFSKIESGKLQLENSNFSLSQVTETVHNLFQSKARDKNIHLTFHIDDDVPEHIIGDSVRLNQILVNLISNALKFTEKGEVSISVKALRQSGGNALIRFQIKDSGIGIPKEKLETVFESFTQASSDTTRKYGGTGLGLTIVKKLVELQKGEISVESAPGTGTTFIIDLPFEKDHAPMMNTKESDQEETLESNYPRGIRVLMAEDNELNQMLSRSQFKKIGWSLDIASNGQMALDMLQQKAYDVVLMDIQMPVMDGHQATLKIRQELPAPLRNIPIIAITAHALNSELEKCLASGMNDYLSKPFKTGELIQKVNVLLKKEVEMVESPEPVALNENILGKPVINLKNLYEMSKHNPDAIKTIVDIFLTKTVKQVDELRQLLKNQDWKNLEKACHKMKSSYAIIGSLEMKGYLETIEEDIRTNNIDINKFELLISGILELNPKVVEELKNAVAA